jgi:hypothetical protein
MAGAGLADTVRSVGSEYFKTKEPKIDSMGH